MVRATCSVARVAGRRTAVIALAVALGLTSATPPRMLRAQVTDSSRVRADSAVQPQSLPTAPRAQSRLSPPISPRRAFLYSLALPGFGQSRLDRGTSGALFSSIELAALVMVRRSGADVREAKRYRIDTLPAEFTVASGLFVPSGRVTNRFTRDLQRARRLHVEDWLAVLAFNHLFAAADAFVAAQLWDVPVSLSARPAQGGAAVVATVHW